MQLENADVDKPESTYTFGMGNCPLLLSDVATVNTDRNIARFSYSSKEALDTDFYVNFSIINMPCGQTKILLPATSVLNHDNFCILR